MEIQNITKFFPAHKTLKLKNLILGFSQHDGESLGDAWERYKDLLRKCPSHGLRPWQQIDIFYNGLDASMTIMLDIVSNGRFLSKSVNYCYPLLEKLG